MSVKNENHENIDEGSASVSKTLESKKYGFVKDLKGADWSRLCDESNSKQSKITFVNGFDQCKELRFRAQNELRPGNSVVTKDVDVENVNGSEEIQTSSTSTLRNVRKSSRNKKKAENSESSATSDAELKVSICFDWKFSVGLVDMEISFMATLPNKINETFKTVPLNSHKSWKK